jgi:ADP-ribose pyrophosphatase YjhB (NUDIX family)
MTNQDAIAVLEKYVRAGEDLPEELFLFVSSVAPMVNVDLLIKDERNRALLTWRDDAFYGAGWHVPGGIIRYKEHAQDRTRRVAEEELGCFVEAHPAPALVTESLSERRERGHFISLLYRCRLVSDPSPRLEAGEIPIRGQWRWHQTAPKNLLPVQREYAALI